MASRLTQLLAKACRISELGVMRGIEYYKTFAHRIQTQATPENFNELTKQFLHTQRARVLSRYESLWEELDYVKHTLKNKKKLDADDAWEAFVFVRRVSSWYLFGMIVGAELAEFEII